MKLRIQDNSLRFRLNRQEVKTLRDFGSVEGQVRFAGGRELRYAVESRRNASSIAVDFEGDSIRVALPGALATEWAETEQVTIEGSRGLGIRLLVEKDFQCLHQPAGPDPDAYPHPLPLGV